MGDLSDKTVGGGERDLVHVLVDALLNMCYPLCIGIGNASPPGNTSYGVF
jgi:hypothetical protein